MHNVIIVSVCLGRCYCCISSVYLNVYVFVCRNKRMLGVLMGTLNRFKADQQKETQTGKVCKFLHYAYNYTHTYLHLYVCACVGTCMYVSCFFFGETQHVCDDNFDPLRLYSH